MDSATLDLGAHLAKRGFQETLEDQEETVPALLDRLVRAP